MESIPLSNKKRQVGFRESVKKGGAGQIGQIRLEEETQTVKQVSTVSVSER